MLFSLVILALSIGGGQADGLPVELEVGLLQAEDVEQRRPARQRQLVKRDTKALHRLGPRLIVVVLSPSLSIHTSEVISAMAAVKRGREHARGGRDDPRAIWVRTKK
jgi:hypothetical protein